VGNESRCDSCIYARVIKGYSEKERLVFCDRAFDPILIPFRVAECSDYSDRRLPRIEHLEKLALLVEVRGAGAGFVPSERPNSQERDDD
jgi:hypothetical protein